MAAHTGRTETGRSLEFTGQPASIGELQIAVRLSQTKPSWMAPEEVERLRGTLYRNGQMVGKPENWLVRAWKATLTVC